MGPSWMVMVHKYQARTLHFVAHTLATQLMQLITKTPQHTFTNSSVQKSRISSSKRINKPKKPVQNHTRLHQGFQMLVDCILAVEILYQNILLCLHILQNSNIVYKTNTMTTQHEFNVQHHFCFTCLEQKIFSHILKK